LQSLTNLFSLEDAMENKIVIGREHVPIKDIAFVELFDKDKSPTIKSEKDFQTRVVLRDNSQRLDVRTLDNYVTKYGSRRPRCHQSRSDHTLPREGLCAERKSPSQARHEDRSVLDRA
jgi:hypothetical protein